MLSFLLTLPVFVCVCVARPQEAAAPPAAPAAPPAVAAALPSVAAAAPRGGDYPPIQIVSQTDETNPDGSFQFSYETGNGIKIEQKGYLKDGANSSEKIQVIEGSVSYTDNEGNPINLKFIADENGFRPEGDHIPKAPEQADHISKALEQADHIPKAQEQAEPATAA